MTGKGMRRAERGAAKHHGSYDVAPERWTMVGALDNEGDGYAVRSCAIISPSPPPLPAYRLRHRHRPDRDRGGTGQQRSRRPQVSNGPIYRTRSHRSAEVNPRLRKAQPSNKPKAIGGHAKKTTDMATCPCSQQRATAHAAKGSKRRILITIKAIKMCQQRKWRQGRPSGGAVRSPQKGSGEFRGRPPDDDEPLSKHEHLAH
ncbi:hypothetical protein L596_020235 [Steinernema carpocapsae]|uniref:Uncharacterized protein n=1 Tax=Steinernema carpocapsae TaxID=34508 RepID=A0A4U5MSY1_STECR|nr:hypothetical protein L596_020235 [Steinernema carpocapsae]